MKKLLAIAAYVAFLSGCQHFDGLLSSDEPDLSDAEAAAVSVDEPLSAPSDVQGGSEPEPDVQTTIVLTSNGGLYPSPEPGNVDSAAVRKSDSLYPDP